MCCISHQATHLLFKYFISKLGRRGEGQNQGKLVDVILEHSLITFYLQTGSGKVSLEEFRYLANYQKQGKEKDTKEDAEQEREENTKEDVEQNEAEEPFD